MLIERVDTVGMRAVNMLRAGAAATLAVAGIAFGAWKTRGFKGNLIDFELPPEE